MALVLDQLCFGPLGPTSAAVPLDGITLIVGPNGAGKSLLLRLIDGLEAPQSGTITNPVPPQQQVHLFHTPCLLDRSVGANLLWAAKQQRIADPQTSIARALDQVGIGHLAGRNALKLSQGEQQLAALARAIVLAPRLLLLDEPAANLSPPARQIVEQQLMHLAQAGTGIIMTSHDMSQAKRLADRVLVMDGGKIIEQSTAKDFFDGPTSKTAQAFLADGL